METYRDEFPKFPNFPKTLDEILLLVSTRDEKGLEEYLNKLITFLPSNVSSISINMQDENSDELKKVTVERGREIEGEIKVEWGFRDLCLFGLGIDDRSPED